MLKTRAKTCARCCHSDHPARNFERGAGPCLQNADVTKPHYRGGCAAYWKGVFKHRPRSGVAAIMARGSGARSSAIGVARGAGVPGGQGTSQRMGCRLRRCACVWLRWRPLCNGLISIGHAPGAGHHQRPRLAEITHGLPRSLQPHTRSRRQLAQGCATLRRCKGLRSR